VSTRIEECGQFHNSRSMDLVCKSTSASHVLFYFVMFCHLIKSSLIEDGSETFITVDW
jgi:hypothetical protein